MKILHLDEIRALYHEETALNKLRAGFQAFSANKIQMPPAQQFLFKDVQGDCCIKSAWMEGSDSFCVKVSSGFYQNPASGLPSNDGLNLLFSAITGQPLVLLDDHGWLTGMRTALAGRIAAELLLPEKIERIAIFGTGLQAELQLRQLCKLTNCRDVIIWGRSEKSLQHMKERLSDLNASIVLTKNEEEAARLSSIIVTATPSTTPLIRHEWVSSGTHITAVGADAPGKQELDAALVGAADMVLVDALAQCSTYGELSHCQGQYLENQLIVEIGTLLTTPSLYQRDPSHITIADLTGLGIQDAQISASILATLS
ncbi:ornithine cyclodeaminase family protein [Pectobacterium carotovorum]|uniref:ornithine cyclodeaminase family protein n=1 Tax=Pectobacterium carotovorum TaxID=554 RepID=UPI0010FE0A9C|nr:ornithine cyclodeaminase family protein [Pectobacterium carotovorum]KAA3668244.1 ornithine cyclodeaminase family protein [Pectobacterium carotovorum subsp. carotovorum]UCZ77699.1 ornithine cyclodeaminase family protein [Pectobacterium carotovorum]